MIPVTRAVRPSFVDWSFIAEYETKAKTLMRNRNAVSTQRPHERTMRYLPTMRTMERTYAPPCSHGYRAATRPAAHDRAYMTMDTTTYPAQHISQPASARPV